ncbi:hypothetical protein B9Q09_01690 [Candidatus Marsarchaeota G2 archaeon ECH_B_SAG-C16]|uniref:Uncharacterized protein n=1 Tax=Candidatus Marsarchaeota G2 archaeon ECH_B_SAG-C16 TaxID=1978163 RepID=A0A2R6BEI6_9ARCH|nr:MAG: hypothetical protein B9Q09_01690 [Candidatus Marsarchaeota G2 archaeon ECH_B_SAG-C16]
MDANTLSNKNVTITHQNDPCSLDKQPQTPTTRSLRTDDENVGKRLVGVCREHLGDPRDAATLNGLSQK